jgi:hypothetical protein
VKFNWVCIVNKLLFLILLCAGLLAGCEQSYNGTVGGASDGSNQNFGTFNPEGARIYTQMCSTCHGIEGTGTDIGTPLVACATCTDTATLADEITRTMPIGGKTRVSDCEGECAQDVAEYIMYAFNGINLYEATSSLEGVSNASTQQTLRSASIQLAGRLPDATEIALVDEQQETGLLSALDRIMMEDEFYDRLIEIFNDVFLTDKYVSANDSDGGIQLLDNDDYPNRYWFNDVYADDGTDTTNDNRNCARRLANDAVAREGLELINYLVRNDLPIKGLVNADYMMVNWYSQQVYDAELIDPAAEFAVLPESQNPCLPYSTSYSNATLRHDPMDFKPARITKQLEYTRGIPHAGILTSAMFLNRFPTTVTNRNRHRSYKVYDIFLDTDILAIEGSRPTDDDELSSPTPTLDNPACYTCHTVMDPVASAFQHWTDRGQLIPSNHQSNRNPWQASDIEAPGLGTQKLPLSGPDGAFNNMLQWLGNEIASDSKFQRAIARHLYEGLVGQKLLPAPGSEASEADITAYNAQRAFINSVGQNMASNNWNLKAAVKTIILSPYYRAQNVDAEKVVSADHIGSSRLLSPEMLQRKLRATMGFDWYQLRNNQQNNRIMYGGIDSDSVTDRITEPSGLMIAMQERMAIEMACRGVAFDFSKPQAQRKIFIHVEPDTEPLASNGSEVADNINAIKQNIQYLHRSLLSEELATDSEELNHSYQLFLTTLQTGQTMLASPGDYAPSPSVWLPWNCRARWDRANYDQALPEEQRIERDDNYIIRAWMAVITYLLSDYRFVYE